MSICALAGDAAAPATTERCAAARRGGGRGRGPIGGGESGTAAWIATLCRDRVFTLVRVCVRGDDGGETDAVVGADGEEGEFWLLLVGVGICA